MKASKSKLKADRPDRSSYFNYKNDGGRNVSCCAATGRKLFPSPGIAETYTFLMNSWNTLPESYQQRVYKHTPATVKRQIQQAENTTPAMVISMEPARVDNAILLDYLTSKVALQEPKIGKTDPNIPIDNNCTDDKLPSGMPGGSGDHEDKAPEGDVRNDIPTASRGWRATTEPERFDQWTSYVDGYDGEGGEDADAHDKGDASQAGDRSTQNVEDWGHSRLHLGTSDYNGYEGQDGDDADADGRGETSPADDGSTQNLENCGHSNRECEDWTVYFRPVIYANGEQMQRQAIFPMRRLYCIMSHHPKAKHIWGDCGIGYRAIAVRRNDALGQRKA